MRAYRGPPEWEGTFEIRMVDIDKERFGWGVFRKGDDKRYNNRWYANQIDAKRGAAQMYRHFKQSFEKNILGQ